MKLLQFGLFLAIAVSMASAGDWWCLWCGPDATTVAPETTTTSTTTTPAPTTTTTTTTPSTNPAPTTTTTTTIPAPTTTTTTTTAAPTTTTTTTPTPAPTTTTTTTTPAPVVLDTPTSQAPTGTLDPSSNLGLVTTTTVAPIKVGIDPLGAVSGMFGFFGSAITNTGNALTGFVTNPFGIFGSNAEARPKDNMWTCVTNMMGTTQDLIGKVGNMVKTCAITMEGDFKLLATGMSGIANSLQTNVVNSWFTANCDFNKGFQACLQTLLNVTVDGLNKSLTEMSKVSTEAISLAASRGAINLECLTGEVNKIIAAMPNFVHSLDCTLNL